jgi:hypothetical protein
MSIKLKYLIFIILMSVLLIPLFQQYTGFIPVKIKPLDGFTDSTTKPVFNIDRWFAGQYQDSLTDWLNQSQVFRPSLVRINNQMQYSFYNKTNAAGVVLGKNRQCFQSDYIYNYTGEFFIGRELIDMRMQRIKFLQDTLQNRGIQLLVVLAPGKAGFMPDNIPDSMIYKTKTRPENNHDYMVEQLKNLNINHIDLHTYFIEMKDTASWPLFPTYGIHWSDYGSYLALDTFLTAARNLTQKHIPELKPSHIELSNIPRGQDYDLGELMNLMFRLPEKELAYPKFAFDDTAKNPEVDILFVGDSYVFHWLKNPIPEYLYKHYNFWYYNVMVYPQFYVKNLYNYNLDIPAEVLKRDIVVLECTERFLHASFWKFEEIMYKYLKPGYHSEPIIYHITDITKDREQFLAVYSYARANNISLEDALWQEAADRAENDAPLGSLEFYIDAIKTNKEWLHEVEKQANEQSVDLEEMIRRNAQWMVDNDEY